MAYTDITPQFRDIVSKSSVSSTKRRKATRGSQKTSEGKEDVQALLNEEYVQEAYAILRHVRSLTRMLSSVRRAYLAVDAGPSTYLHRDASRIFDPNGADEQWSSIRHLTNEERDQIDLQARIILSKCADRVKQLEALEKKRSELSNADENVFTRMLPGRLKASSSSATSANRAAHHASITYYLNRCLTEASQNQREMQEERIKRQMERSRTLGSSATKEAANVGLGDLIPLSEPISLGGSGAKSWLGDAASNFASSFRPLAPINASPTVRAPTNAPALQNDYEDDSDDDFELTLAQVQQFETENTNLLRSVQDTLASVQQAESRLMDISALQMELVAHLMKQSELTDQLYEDAISTSATVEKGNEQLREAKRRAKDGRLYVLVFLVGASFALLFLHYY